MATVTLNSYDTFRERQVSGVNGLDLVALIVKVLIVTNTYTPNQNLHDFEDDLGANEVTGTGYIAGGNVCSNVTVTLDGAGLVTVDCDDPAIWTENAAGFSNGRRAIFYVDRGGASSANELIAYSEAFVSDEGNVSGDFSVTINPSGLLTSAR